MGKRGRGSICNRPARGDTVRAGGLACACLMLLVLYLEQLYPLYCCPPWFWPLPTSLQGFSPSHSQTPGTWSWAAELWWVAGCDLGLAGGVHLLLCVTNSFLTPHQRAPSLLVPEAGKQQVSVCSCTIDSPAGGASVHGWRWSTARLLPALNGQASPGHSSQPHRHLLSQTYTGRRRAAGGELFFIVFAINGLKVCVSLFSSLLSFFSLVFLQRMKVLGRPITEREGTRSQCSRRVGKASARSVKSLPRRVRKGPH